MKRFRFRLLNNEEAMKEADKSSEILWNRLTDLFDLVFLGNDAYDQNESVTQAVEKFKKVSRNHDFSEDFLVRGLGIGVGDKLVRDERSYTKVEEV